VFEILVPVIATCLSLYILGVIRTALWLALALLAGAYYLLISVSILSFLTVMIAFAPYRAGAFDFRNMSKQKIYLSFFFTGVATGVLFFPTHPLICALAVIISYLTVQIFKVFKFPVNYVIFAPKKLRWIVITAWLFCALLKYLLWNTGL
jgi:hypothetical protein